MNIHYSPILHGCMNTRRDKARLKCFQILLDSGCIFTTVTRRLIKKSKTKEDVVMKWLMPLVNITTNMKVKIDFTVPEFSGGGNRDLEMSYG